MKPFKTIVGFFLRFLGVYIGLYVLVVATGCDSKSRDFYGNTIGKYYKNLSSKAQILAEPVKKEKTKLLVKILNKKDIKKAREQMRMTGKRMEGKILAYYTNAHINFLMPLIFLFSLIVVYPSDIKRKLKSLALGLLLMVVYIYFKLACSLIYTIDESQEFFPEYELPFLINKFLGLIEGLFTEAAYLVGALIWVAVCVRKADIKKLKIEN